MLENFQDQLLNMADRLSNVIRRKFVDYFTIKHNHKFVPSSPVVPNNDRTLEFVNSGMNQFKHLFIEDKLTYSLPRVCNYQKCIRVGGKLCDLDLIGKDTRHHTFFEMLGNWSFNDYGKQETCEWALDFLVNHLNLDINKIVVTYLSSQEEDDIETRDIWLKLGIPATRVIAKGEEDNFWYMGSSGPCGPSSEIYYPIGDASAGEELLEIWNLVFIDRTKLPDSQDTLPLRNKFVDTGMGLERIVSVLNGTKSNYDTDLFAGHFEAIHKKSPKVQAYGGSLTANNQLDIDYRILSDHSRMITVALSDGIIPGRRGDAFNLRTIIKKSLDISRHSFHQEMPRLLIFDLIDETIKSLSDAYPQLGDRVRYLRRIVAKESKRYQLISQYKEIQERGKEIINVKQFLRMSPAHSEVIHNDNDNNTDSDSDNTKRDSEYYCLSGRVANLRTYKRFHFIDLNDGSTKDGAQLVISRDLIDKPQLGSYITCKGKIVPSKGTQQNSEFKVDKVIYLGECEPEEYPLATIGDKSWNALRQKLHLRPRTKYFASLLRVRSELEMALHLIMKQMDFFRVHTPSFTSNDSEASSDLFTIRRTKIESSDIIDSDALRENLRLSEVERAKEKMDELEDEEEDDDDDDLDEADDPSTNRNLIIDDGTLSRSQRDDYFNKDIYLITSGQLHLECLAASLSRVYTLSQAFRAENSQTRRHLCEFLMFEAEESNLFELNPLMDRVETIIKFTAQYLSEISEHSRDFQELVSVFKNETNLQHLIQKPFIRLEYHRALQLIREKMKDFQGPAYYGCNLGREHELRLLRYFNNTPIFITNYPKKLKPFYMKTSTSTRQNALCFDLIAPWGGEICGGSLREDDPEKLIKNIENNSSDHQRPTTKDNFNWYLETRQFGTFPHGGFGIGFERLIQTLVGIKNIRDTTPFPRWSGRCAM